MRPGFALIVCWPAYVSKISLAPGVKVPKGGSSRKVSTATISGGGSPPNGVFAFGLSEFALMVPFPSFFYQISPPATHETASPT